MCLAIPALITETKPDRMATVNILGVTREVALDLTPQAEAGDYVLVHAGFAIEVVDEQFAQETIDLIKQFPDLADLEGVGPAVDDAASGQADAGAQAPAIERMV